MKKKLLKKFPCEEELIDAFIADYNGNAEDLISQFEEYYWSVAKRDLGENYPDVDDETYEDFIFEVWDTKRSMSDNLYDFQDYLDDYKEELEEWYGTLDEEELETQGLEVVTWPESQSIMDVPHYRSHAWLINSQEGLDTYGSAAYVVEKEWFN